MKRILTSTAQRPRPPGLRAGRRPAEHARRGQGRRELARRQRHACPGRKRPGGEQDAAAAERPTWGVADREAGRHQHRHVRSAGQGSHPQLRGRGSHGVRFGAARHLHRAVVRRLVRDPRSYVSRTFTVGKVDRLDVSEATPSGAFATRIILIDPTGTYAAYSIPQGGGNYGHVDVRKPRAGTWTAYFALSKSSGFRGTVAYSIVQTDTSTHGTVSPRYRVLRPGQKGTFTVHPKLPTSPGDLSASVQLAGSSGTTTSVPMTLRAVVPPRNTTFVGTITGGNGRQAGGVAQSNVYRLDVPSGKRDLSIGVTFSEPGQTVFGYLSAPDGQVYSFQGNLADGHALQLYRRDPMKGRWTFSLEVTNPVSGLETSQSFVAHVAYNTVEVRAAVPTSRSTKLAAGVPVTVPVRIKNTGVAPITYAADARLKTSGTIPLVELSGHATSPLPMPADVTPLWLVPTEVTHTEFTAVGDQPVNLDVNFQSGNPERYSAATRQQRHRGCRRRPGLTRSLGRRRGPDRSVQRPGAGGHRHALGHHPRSAVRPRGDVRRRRPVADRRR